MSLEHNINLPYNYSPRPYQKPFWWAMQDGIKRSVLVWHRRAGKEKTCWNYLITQALQRRGTYYYIFPDNKMARRIIWDGMDKEGFKTLHHIPDELIDGVNNTEMKISLKNGSKVLLLGSHDVDKLRGPNPIGCVFSEYAEQSPMAWQTISPILRENEGWAIFNFTPKGQNHARDLFEMAKVNPLWFAELLTVENTDAISREEVERERKEAMMSDDMIQQEYYCSFTLGVEGSYYAKYIQQAKESGRIGNVPHDPSSRVYTAWDLGYGDSTSIVFYQVVGKEVHIIDYYEDHGKGLPHYVKMLRDKPYIYADHYAPHDVESHAFSSGLSAKEVGADLGIKFITLPTLKIRLEDGIEAARGVFYRLWIDAAKGKFLIKCLENYRKEFDDKNNVYKLRPLHDWSSHGADAFRYMAIAVRMFVDSESAGISDKEADRLYNLYNPKFG
jgi:phage terminase large subunit